MDKGTQDFILELVKIIAPIATAGISYLVLREQNRVKGQLKHIEEFHLHGIETELKEQGHEVVKAAAQAAHSKGIAEGVKATLEARTVNGP